MSSIGSRRPQILICDDDQMYQLALRQVLKKDFEVLSAFHTDEALAIVRNRKIDLLLLDVRLRTSTEGLESIPKFKALDEELPLLILSGLKEFETVREAMRQGASDYISKEVEAEELVHVIHRVLEKKALLLRSHQQSSEAGRAQKNLQLVGESSPTQNLRRLLERARSSTANVVIYGETGTGKEVVARLLRESLSDGSWAPFVAVDSSTIHHQTAESILFGHEKGAFTGADRAKKGIFEEAHGGIVYFDEIANMPLEIQAKLLRVIQEKEVTRLGGSRSIPLEFRVICATNKKLEDLIQQGHFKEDLYQRLNVIPIALAPLRERSEDVGELLRHFSKVHSQNGRILDFSEEAIKFLEAYPWPGNIRELGNLVAYLYAMSDSDLIEVADLPPKMRDQMQFAPSRSILSGSAFSEKSESDLSFYERIGRYEADILRNEYEALNGNVSKLALRLGMDRSHLYTKLKVYGIHNQKRAGATSGATTTSDAALSA